MAKNTDFIGFTFNGRHSSEFNIYSVSDGSRYQDTLVPSPIDYSEQIAGGIGSYYFGSDMDVKEFPLSIAYDNLSEKQIREMRKWLAPDVVGELIFDERPYKTYIAKISGPPTLSFICFDDSNNKRVYKGEGEINFICYYPLAETAGEKKELKWYQNKYSNINEWAKSSGLANSLLEEGITFENEEELVNEASSTITLFNPGDLETDFILTFNKSAGVFSLKLELESEIENPNTLNYIDLTCRDKNETGEEKETNDEKYGELSEEEKALYDKSGKISVNTKTKTITFEDNTTKEITPAYFLLKSGGFFRIPVNYFQLDETISKPSLIIESKANVNDIRLKYNYLYY